MTVTSAVIAVLAVVGAGVSAYSAYEQGKTADSIANYNARQNDVNARHQLLAMEAQAAVQRQEAEAKYRLQASQAEALQNNAITLQNQADGESNRAREGMKRKADEYAAAQGTQRAMIAKSGFVESSGTPLDILAETAATIQLEREDALYTDELNRRTLFRQAEMEKLGGRLALAGATLDRSSVLAGAGMAAAAGQMQYRSSLRESEIMRLSGAAAKRAGTLNATGTLISGVAGAYGSYAQMNQYGNRAAGAKTAAGTTTTGAIA